MSTPDEVAAFLSRHRADQAAMEASRCYAADTCTLDIGCPFAVNCLEVEGRNRD